MAMTWEAIPDQQAHPDQQEDMLQVEKLILRPHFPKHQTLRIPQPRHHRTLRIFRSRLYHRAVTSCRTFPLQEIPVSRRQSQQLRRQSKTALRLYLSRSRPGRSTQLGAIHPLHRPFDPTHPIHPPLSFQFRSLPPLQGCQSNLHFYFRRARSARHHLMSKAPSLNTLANSRVGVVTEVSTRPRTYGQFIEVSIFDIAS